MIDSEELYKKLEGMEEQEDRARELTAYRKEMAPIMEKIGNRVIEEMYRQDGLQIGDRVLYTNMARKRERKGYISFWMMTGEGRLAAWVLDDSGIGDTSEPGKMRKIG
jgi:hypothetical protein